MYSESQNCLIFGCDTQVLTSLVLIPPKINTVKHHLTIDTALPQPRSARVSHAWCHKLQGVVQFFCNYHLGFLVAVLAAQIQKNADGDQEVG
jgi:hypothetical protein